MFPNIYIYIYIYIYVWELSHVIIKADKSKIFRVGQQAGTPGELMPPFQFKACQVGEPGRASIPVLVQKTDCWKIPTCRSFCSNPAFN